jgi:hypothetical protein
LQTGDVIVFTATVDRVALVKHVTDTVEYGAFLEVMHNHRNVNGCKVWKKKYVTCAKIALSSKASVYLQAGMANGKLYQKVDVSPTKLSKKDWDHLHVVLSLGVEGGLHGLATNGRVSYIELAADVKNMKMDDWLPFHERHRDSLRIPTPPEPVETYYLGAKRGARSFCVYDKRRELLTRHGVKLGHDLLRIEVRLRNLGAGLAGVRPLPNPFAGFGISPIADLRELSTAKDWHMFLDIAEQQGPQVALCWGGKNRPLYLKRLKSVSCVSWNPDNVWTKARHRIKRLDRRLKSYEPIF